MAHAAVTVAKVAYKVSGAQSVVSCVTDPSVGSCVQAAISVGMIAATIATGGAAAGADIAVDAALEAGEEGAVEAGEEGVVDAAESCMVGGSSFKASTKVLLANGTSVPIARLKTGEKVLATNTKTGKTEAETVTAVMVHHDTNLYDLKVRAQGKTSVIHTTSNHLFWVPGSKGLAGRWIKAGALKYGTHLRTPSTNGTAVVTGGSTPVNHDGWMWDITVPGDNDHDFYIQTAATGVLVHNCGGLSNAAKSTILQMGIGAGTGGLGSFLNGEATGQSTTQIVEGTIAGTFFGALSNAPSGSGVWGSVASLGIGAATGAANGVANQMISSQSADLSGIDLTSVEIDAGIGLVSNHIGNVVQGMGKGSHTATWGNTISGVFGIGTNVPCDISSSLHGPGC